MSYTEWSINIECWLYYSNLEDFLSEEKNHCFKRGNRSDSASENEITNSVLYFFDPPIPGCSSKYAVANFVPMQGAIKMISFKWCWFGPNV